MATQEEKKAYLKKYRGVKKKPTFGRYLRESETGSMQTRRQYANMDSKTYAMIRKMRGHSEKDGGK